jgi:hypothetical protein
MVRVPPIAEVKYEVLKVALPVMVPALRDEPMKVALPIIYTLFVLVPVNITPVVFAPPVRPVELTPAELVQLFVSTTGAVLPISAA